MERRTTTTEQKFLALIAGPPKSIGVRFIRAALRLASWGYGFGAVVRNVLFDLGVRQSHSSEIPLISVGNLTTGGTGKTPVVAMLVELLKSAGQKPGIISRGYRELDSGENDEARVLKLICPETPHLQNRDRVVASREIVDQYQCSVIVADDAFQHRRLRRNLDVVLIDALNPWGHNALLPRGLLREPVSGLSRADVVILTRADLVDDVSREKIWNRVRANSPDAVNVEVGFPAVELIDLEGKPRSIESLDEKHRLGTESEERTGVLAFCGIGNPDGFQRTLDAAGVAVQELVPFPDHHHYDEHDLQRLSALAEQCEAGLLLTTVKDLVKINAEWVGAIPVVALNIKADVLSGQSSLVDTLAEVTRPEIP